MVELANLANENSLQQSIHAFTYFLALSKSKFKLGNASKLLLNNFAYPLNASICDNLIFSSKTLIIKRST